MATTPETLTADTEIREYELAYVATANTAGLSVRSSLEREGATVTREVAPVPVRLAYPIKKHATGFLGIVIFSAPAAAAPRISTALQASGEVLRFLITTPPIRKPERAPWRERAAEPSPSPAAQPSSDPVLSNAALEQKLEEILK